MLQHQRKTTRMPRGPALLLVAALILAAGCAEPVNCAAFPDRCLPPAHALPQLSVTRVPAVVAAASEAAKPAMGVLPLGDSVRPQQRALAPSDSMAARKRPGTADVIRPVGASDRPTAAAGATDPRLSAVRLALGRALPALKAHDFAGLGKLAQEPYAKHLLTIEGVNAERFWRLGERYQKVLGSTDVQFRLEDQPGKLQVYVTSGAGELRPVLVLDNGTWKFERL